MIAWLLTFIGFISVNGYFNVVPQINDDCSMKIHKKSRVEIYIVE